MSYSSNNTLRYLHKMSIKTTKSTKIILDDAIFSKMPPEMTAEVLMRSTHILNPSQFLSSVLENSNVNRYINWKNVFIYYFSSEIYDTMRTQFPNKNDRDLLNIAISLDSFITLNRMKFGRITRFGNEEVCEFRIILPNIIIALYGERILASRHKIAYNLQAFRSTLSYYHGRKMPTYRDDELESLLREWHEHPFIARSDTPEDRPRFDTLPVILPLDTYQSLLFDLCFWILNNNISPQSVAPLFVIGTDDARTFVDTLRVLYNRYQS